MMETDYRKRRYSIAQESLSKKNSSKIQISNKTPALKLSALKALCKQMDLEDAYRAYKMRIYNNYVGTLSIMHLTVMFIHAMFLIIDNEINDISNDIYVYLISGSLVFFILRLYLRRKISQNTHNIGLLVSWLVIMLMTFTDIVICSILTYGKHYVLRPCYCGYVISSIYLFMPLMGFAKPICLGVVTSLMYGCIFICTSTMRDVSSDEWIVYRYLLAPNVFFLICLNLLGVYTRWRMDMVTRTIFLTKRESLEQSILLNYAKDQEKSLLISIIPEPIAKKIGQDIKHRIEQVMRGITPTIITGRKLFIETHQDVSILFADVVNYTYLTTKLDVKTLVETLHELFLRFDSACSEYNVMRIKFLGDCYYGVSGVPVSHSLHGVCCIELGRSIIKHIREVRTIRELDIDMRIGIHSGSILSGIIGSSKWQYDIWSKDVDIANRLESTGVAGRVHVSKATLNLAEDFYLYEDGPESARNDPKLIKNSIQTYLIIGPSEKMNTSPEWLNYMQSKMQHRNSATITTFSGGIGLSSYDSVEYVRPLPSTSNQMLVYEQAWIKANHLMNREIKKLPICKVHLHEYYFIRQKRLAPDEMEEFKAKRSITTICLLFNDWNWEIRYLRRISELLKYEMLAGNMFLWSFVSIQALTPITNLIGFWTTNIFLLTLDGILLVCIWLEQINKYFQNLYNLSGNGRSLKVLRHFIYYIQRSISIRILFYVIMLMSLVFASCVHLMFCDNERVENDDDLIFAFLDGDVRIICFNSWAITESICIFVALAFSISFVPFFVPVIMTLPFILLYSYLILTRMSVVYESSFMTNASLKAEYSHIWNVFIMWYIYQLSCRHIIFTSKYNYYSRWQLDKKFENARVTNESIRVLLHNILPSHVVQKYLSKAMHNEAYYEKHKYVAVMFATVIHADSEDTDLRLMNEIVCDFDDVLSFYKNTIKIEKIKVINWTYMAACGFRIKATDTFKRQSKYRPSKSQISIASSTYGSLANILRQYRSRPQQSNLSRRNRITANAGDAYDLDDERINSLEHGGGMRSRLQLRDSILRLVVSTETVNWKRRRNIESYAQERDSMESVPFENMQSRRRFSTRYRNRYRTVNEYDTDVEEQLDNDDDGANENTDTDTDEADDLGVGTDAANIDIDYSNNTDSTGNLTNAEKPPPLDANTGSKTSSKIKDNQKLVLHVMSSFALDLLKVIEAFNIQMQEKLGSDYAHIKLRIGNERFRILQIYSVQRYRALTVFIGISAGEVMAGIVGSSQAHYDIWGDAVNMASRMDSTGVPGKIQVIEDTAKVLLSNNIDCSYRGLTYVKGRGHMPTYFISITDDYEFKSIN